jgi:fructose-specific phosphotransferase system IIA component
MTLTRALSPSCVKVPLEATDKDGIIAELVDSLHENGFLPDRDKTLGEIFDREQIRSTGVGYGIAIPHGYSSSVRDVALAVGIPRVPVEFDSVDGKPVSIVVLLVSPARQTGAHIQALAQISRMMLDPEFREALAGASSVQTVYELFTAGEMPGVAHKQRQMAVA